MYTNPMDDPSEGCYCAQALTCPHWIAAKMDRRMATAKEHSHARAKTFGMGEQELLQEDHRPIVSELQRELRTAMLEIEKLAKTSRDLAKVNQELEESRLLAVSDQARTAKRLELVSSQLEYTEQQLFNLTKERDSGQKASELLRIERIKRETLQEREDAGRLKIETLQDELQEVQRSEQMLHQKLTTVQSKYETLSKRHDNLKRQQQELELARESKEALAWLKETTDRLCSPPQGSLGQAFQQERSSHGSAAISIHRSSPPSSPPYPSSFIDPPLAAQNQLISLIKELATTNSTLRSELNEYRDLLQDTRNEMLTLRSQVEDYEQGHAFANCCGGRVDDDESFRTSISAWSTLDIPIGGGLDAVSHIGTLGSAPGSPPPYMTTPKASSRHHLHHHHPHTTGVRGSVFGELERLYSQSHQDFPSEPIASNLHGRDNSNKIKRRTSNGHEDVGRVFNNASDTNLATTILTPIFTSETRRGSNSTMASARSPLNPIPSKLRDKYGINESSPTSNTSKSRKSMRPDVDVDMINSVSDFDEDNGRHRREEGTLDLSSDVLDSEENQDKPGFVTGLATTKQYPGPSSQPGQGSLALLSPANLDDALHKGVDELMPSMLGPEETFDLTIGNRSDSVRGSPLNDRESPISLLSAELQRATQCETKNDIFSGGDNELTPLEHEIHTFTEDPITYSNFARGATMDENLQDFPGTAHYDKASSEELASLRQQRRLSEPLNHQPGSNSLPVTKSRPSSIYSLRKPRPRMDSPSLHCIHSPHVTSTSVGGAPELQKCKSAELVEQIIAEQRHRTMEAWRVGVVAAAVTQQQSIHSVVAFGEHRRDLDNMSIRSKASRRRGKGPAVTEPIVKEIEEENVDAMNAPDPNIHSLPSKDSESTIRETYPPEENTQTVSSVAALAPGASKALQDKASKDKKRQSVRSMRSIRSSILRSPMVRSLHARDRKFPSEASTASEAFSNRRYDLEHSPYQLLHTLSMDLLERLTRSDTRELNRRLRRTFDIQALSQMSNSVIENALTDVNNLGERFRWLEEQVADPIDEMLDHQPVDALSGGEGSLDSEQDDIDEDALDDQEEEEEDEEEEGEDWSFSVEEFFPLAHTVQEMLSEIGKLRMTINELQLSYVLKVEQDRIKAERDFMHDLPSDDEGDYGDTPIMDPRSNQVSEKPAQLKNVLGMLDRPRILGSASTGVSGFFNKVFGGSGQPPSEDTTPPGAPKPFTNADDMLKDKPSISRSKSGVVLAETSRIIADSPWISSPGNPPGLKTVGRSSLTTTSRRSGTSSIAIPGSRLSATTSLAAMATMSLARSSTVQMAEGLMNTHLASSARARPIDISFNTETKQANVPCSPITGSSTGMPAQGILSRSLPQNQSTSLHSTDTVNRARHETSEHIPAPTSYQDMSIISEEAKVPNTPSMTEPTGLDLDNNAASSRTPASGQRSHVLNKTPRSIGMSTRTGGPAINVVTKQDVFHEHWTSSTPSSFSATVSTVPSRATSERRATVDSFGEDAALADPNKGGSSMASLSSNSGSIEIISSGVHKPVPKPTLIARSTLTVATPSTSTVSSPMSTASWFDSRHYSGGHGQDTILASESKPSESSRAPTLGSVTEPKQVSGSSGAVIEHQLLRKPQATTSFHADAALGGSNDSVTKSLGRAGGRESALAFLRGEVQVSSILGSILQSQSLAPGQSSIGSPSLQRSSSSRAYKGKNLASDDLPDSDKTSVEILTGRFEDGEEIEAQGGNMKVSGMHRSSSQTIVSSFLDSSSTQLGHVSTPTTGLSQRTAVTSTAVAYVVATPDAHGTDDKERKKRAVFDRELIKASQKRILAGIPPQDKPFVPQASPRRARALSVDSAQSTEPLKANEIMDLWRVGAGVSRDLWRGLIKKVDGRDP